MTRRLAHMMMWCVAIAVATCCVACERGPRAHGQFVAMPSRGWTTGSALHFAPQYDDSAARYDIAVAVRHTAQYGYDRLNMTVDLIDTAHRVSRRVPVTLLLADEHGNWLDAGFGTYYQATATISNVTPTAATTVVLWPAMDGVEIIDQLVDVGIIVTPRTASTH